MNNTRIAQIKKSASISAKVLKVFRIIITVGACIAAVSAILCLIFRNSPNGAVVAEGDGWRVLIPGAEMALSDETGHISGGFDFINDLHIKNMMVWAAANSIVAAALMAIIAVTFRILEKVFVEIRDSETPFTESIMKRIKVVGIIVTILTLLNSLGTAVVVGLSFWCIYNVFGYGMELQKDVDETL